MNMKNAALIEMQDNAEKHTVERKELGTDPKMQMRVEMDQDTIDQYAENIEAILEKHPIEVVVVDTHGYETWYIVDGFHRYHAAVKAGVTAVEAMIMRGTYEQAVQYAMSANWKNGLRPKGVDAERSISMLLETAPDFGFDSKEVNKWVTSFGIPESTANNWTSDLIKEVKEKRDAEIKRLDAEGLSQVKIATVVGTSRGTVQNVLVACQKTPVEEISTQESTPMSPEDLPFDEDELDTTPAYNPADDDELKFKSDKVTTIPQTEAFKNELSRHEAERTHQENNNVVDFPTPSKEQPWAWTAYAADAMDEAFSDHSLGEMAKFLKDDEHAMEEFNRVLGFMKRVTSLI